MKKVKMLVDNEVWAPADIPPHFQTLAERLVSIPQAGKMVNEFDLYEEGYSSSSGPTSPMHPPAGSGGADDDDDDRSTSGKYLIVEGRRWALTASTLLFLKILVEYLKCAAVAPAIVSDLVGKIAEIVKVSVMIPSLPAHG
jgi:hypothetical protein